MLEEPQKPTILIDIKRTKLGGVNPPVFIVSKRPKTRAFSSYLSRILEKSFFVIVVVAILSLRNFVVAPTAVFSQNYAQERSVLEAQLVDLEKQISEHEAAIERYKKQGNNLQSEISQLNTQIAKINLQIKAVTVSIKSLDREIRNTEGDIVQTEDKIGFEKRALGDILQSIYEGGRQSFFEIVLENPQLSDFFGDLNNLVLVQNNLHAALGRYVDLKDQYVDQKQTLSLERKDAAALRTYQATQKMTIEKTQETKHELLKVTKGKESEYQKILKETKVKAAEIRSRIFRLLGGGELPFGDAVKIAKVAEKATGVRAALTLSVLTQESSASGIIGKNVGRCVYNDPRNNPSGTVMSDKEKPIFLALIADLKLNPDNTPVSCPITSDGLYGGAMGPAQFMPSTWKLYADRIAKITGGNPPSPFNNLDAFTGTALYLKNGLSGCVSSYSTQFSQENCAAAKYYAGNSWRSYMRVGSYGYRVADRAQAFQKDIDILDE
ncbi:MAG: hypothetical protein HZA35_03700 [Parcubacteria group bacterium]|nr:hypothetical protein [Parcubacteria group bacterium]